MSNLLLKSIADTTTNRDREGVHGAIAQLLSDFLRADSITIYRLLDDNGVTRLVQYAAITQGLSQLSRPLPDDFSTLPKLVDMPEWCACVQEQRVIQYVPCVGTAYAALPITTDREVAGLLVIKSRHRLRTRDIEHVRAILRILNNHLALLDYGEVDTLTGMLNRKTYDASFEKIRQRLRAADHAHNLQNHTWIGLVDIDKFKCVNDTYGHLFGDEVLLLVSRIMKQCFRGMDRLFRFGGEEFVVVLDQATTDGAQIAFDRLRTTIEAFEFPQVGRVTISLGYSQIQPTDSPTTCVDRADAALYYAKHHGRNAVRCYEALIVAGELVAKIEEDNVELF